MNIFSHLCSIIVLDSHFVLLAEMWEGEKGGLRNCKCLREKRQIRLSVVLATIIYRKLWKSFWLCIIFTGLFWLMFSFWYSEYADKNSVVFEAKLQTKLTAAFQKRNSTRNIYVSKDQFFNKRKKKNPFKLDIPFSTRGIVQNTMMIIYMANGHSK